MAPWPRFARWDHGDRPLGQQEVALPTAIKEPYLAARDRLVGEGFVFDAKTCFYERGGERLQLRWNGRVYARRRGPPKPEAFDHLPL